MMFNLIAPGDSIDQLARRDEFLQSISHVHDGLISKWGYKHKDRYWIYTEHPIYGIIGGLSMKPAEYFGLLDKDEDIFVNFSGSTPKGWSASHLFFHLPGDVMEGMTDQELKILMQTFYSGLYKTLMELGASLTIPYFTVIFHKGIKEI